MITIQKKNKQLKLSIGPGLATSWSVYLDKGGYYVNFVYCFK